MSRTINLDREFRRGRIGYCLERHIARHRRLETRTRYPLDADDIYAVTGAPIGAPYSEWMNYQKWRDERTIMLRKLRKDCR